MSTCTAEEIAEKKRVALERLKAKKNQQSTASTGSFKCNTTNKPTPLVANASKVEESKVNLTEKPTTSFYQPQNKVPNVGPSANKASEFIAALKQSSSIASRLEEARASTHPYQKNIQNPRPSHDPNQLTSRILNTSQNSPKQQVSVYSKTVSCTAYMVSQNRFAVVPSCYHEKLIEVFKLIPSRSYDGKTRIWTFALKDYQMVQKHVEGLKPNIAMGSIPKNVLQLCQKPAKEIDKSCLTSIETTLANKLLPFQREGVCFAIAQHGRLMICDEMGLGKTYQALAIADFYKEDWPVLICTTASTRETWATHVRELLPSIPCHNILVLTTHQQYCSDAKVVITSYNMMERCAEKLYEKKFNFLIFDESHMLKNGKAKCTIVAERLSLTAKRTLLLTGTPALSRPLELFTQLNMVDRRFMTFMEFTTRYCAGKQSNFGWDATGQSNLEELNVVLKLKFMIRRVKAEVLPQLSEKFRETVTLDPALVWSKGEYKESLNKFADEFSRSKGREKEEILLRFYAETATVKAPAVCAYLKTLVKEKKKFIVFAHHKVMMDAISEYLDKMKIKFIRIDGSTRNDIRADNVNTFQKKASCLVAVLSLKACNSGITLTAAELVVFAELDWNPSTLAQAESRAHRIGQINTVVCRYLMAAKTADDVIWNMLKAKQDVLNRAGLFSENLQEATHTAAPLSTKKIDDYFDPKDFDGTFTSDLKTQKLKDSCVFDPKDFDGTFTSDVEPQKLKDSCVFDLKDCDGTFMSDLEPQQLKESSVARKEDDVNDDIVQQLFNDDDDAFMDLAY